MMVENVEEKVADKNEVDEWYVVSIRLTTSKYVSTEDQSIYAGLTHCVNRLILGYGTRPLSGSKSGHRSAG